MVFPTIAQQPAPQQPVKIRTSEVLLDVLVQDRKGRPVFDLKPEEIEVYEDGVKQSIARFTAVGAPAAARREGPAAPPAEGEATGAREQLNLVTLLIDHLPAVRVQPVRDAAFNFLDNSITDKMLVRVMVIGRRLYVIEQFTNDRAKLRKAIERATSTVEKSFAEISDRIASELKPIAGEEGAAAGADALLARVTLETLTASEKLSREVRSSLHVFPLMPFSRAHRHVSGRKMALYFSDGLYMPPGFTDVLRAAISEANRSNVSFYSINIRNLLVGAGNQTSRLETATVVNQTRRPETATFNSGLADSFSTSDRVAGRGQITTNFSAFEVLDRSRELNKQSPLADLTEGTGGFQLTNANDLNGALKRVASELGHYYAISYTPSRTEYDGRFRAITVKALRSGLRVKARSGYFALPPTSNSRPVVAFETPLLAALNGAVVPRDFAYRTATLHFESRPHETHCEALMELPLANFIHEADRAKKSYSVGFAVMALIKDEKGEVVQSFSEPHEMEIPEAMAGEARKSSYTMTRHFWLAPGRYTLETAVHDQKTGRLSAERRPFDVKPPSPGVQTGSLFLVRQIEQIDAQNNSDPDNPLIIGEKRVIPDLEDRLPQGSRGDLSFHLPIFPDAQSKEKPSLKLELLLDGRVIGASAPALPRPDDLGRINFTAGIDAARFTPGDYKFHAIVTQGGATAEEAAEFHIPGERKRDAVVEEKTIASSLSASDAAGELTLTALRTVQPLELSPKGLIQEVLKSGERNYARLNEYTYALRKVRRVLTPRGKIKSEEYHDYEAYPVRGKHALIQLAENGSRLPNQRIDLNRRHATDVLVRSEEEMHRLSQPEADELNQRIGYWGASIEGRNEQRGLPRRSVYLTIDPDVFFRSCEFSSPRMALLESRETVVLDFRPLPGAKLDEDKDWIGRLAGTVWIDAADRTLVRIEGQSLLNQEAAATEPPINFVYQQQRLDAGVWGPSLIRINSAGDERLFRGLNWDAWFQFTNFKRFDSKISDVKIVSPDAKQE
ncbi:MAG: VWA domain-containing protein [Blastocatellia bacterium]